MKPETSGPKSLLTLPEQETSINEYEDYHQTSKQYDTTRVPVGIDRIVETLEGTTAALSDQTVLDAGCGTGSYLIALADKVRTMHGIDLNSGMLAKAEARSEPHTNVHLREGAITDLPYDSNTFDGILCNQVLHHVSDGDASRDDYAAVRQVVQSAHDTLKKNGALIFNISSHEQCKDGFWWASLIPEAVEIVVTRTPSLDMLQAIMEEVGFERVGSKIVVDDVLQGENYFDSTGPLKKMWRDGDSTWSLASDQELAHAITKVTALKNDGDADQYLIDQDVARKDIGQTTCFFGYKT